MGHLRLGNLPRTRKWQQVVQLIDAGASAAQTATATIAAAEAGFRDAGHSAPLVQAVWRLAQLPLAARSDDFADGLRQCGFDVGPSPSLLGICAAVSDGCSHSDENDFGEMARMAAAEALQRVVGPRLAGLFGASSADLQRELASLGTPKQFGILARQFFARLTERHLKYFLSRTMAHHVGDGRRFATLAQTGEFAKAVTTHCDEAAAIVETYAGDWFSKTNWKDGDVSKAAVSSFVAYAMEKLLAELRQGAAHDAT